MSIDKETLRQYTLGLGFAKVNFTGGALAAALPYGNMKDEISPPESFCYAQIAPFARKNYYKEAVSRLKKVVAFACENYGGKKSDYQILCNSRENEKELALKSGLGGMGRNTLILNEECGSLFIIACLKLPFALASALSNAEGRLSPSCKNCHSCVNACPTAALLGDGSLIRERCIQWYASGNGENVPDEVKMHWGHTLYGCTICQDSCPLNKKPIAGSETTFGLLPAYLDAEKILSQSGDELTKFFKGTAMGMKWLGAKAIKRNAQLIIEGVSRRK